MSFDAIKIGLASPEKIRGVVPWRGKKTGDHQLQNAETGKKTVCSVKESSDQAKTGSAIAVNIRKFATKA